jgi:hypothetical protein
MYDTATKTATYSHLTTPITIPAAPTPTFALTAPTSGTFTASQLVTINWTAANVSANNVVSLCLDKDTKMMNGNEKWIEIDQAKATDGHFTFNTTGYAPGTYYIGGYMYDNVLKKATYSPYLSQPIVISASTNSVAAVSNLNASVDSLNVQGGTDGASLVDNNPSNLAVTTKDFVFSSNVQAASITSNRPSDTAGADNQYDEEILAQTDARKELAAIDRVLQDQDAWLPQSERNWLA